MRDIARFTVVGAGGFVTDGGLLLLMLFFNVPMVLAKILSYCGAVLVTWSLNRLWTFPHHDIRKFWHGFVKYIAGQTIGAGINFGVFFATLFIIPSLIRYPLVPLGISAVVALVFNFLVAKHIVFKNLDISK